VDQRLLAYETLDEFERLSAKIHGEMFRFFKFATEGNADVRFPLQKAAECISEFQGLLKRVAEESDKLRHTPWHDKDNQLDSCYRSVLAAWGKTP
jgi:hypothetical protein